MLRNNAAQKQAKELEALEAEYRYMVKNVPPSFNGTREWHKKLQKCVSRMRVLHNRPEGTRWLQEILTREARP